MTPDELIQTVNETFGVDVIEHKCCIHTHHNDAVYFCASIMREWGLSYFDVGIYLDRSAPTIRRGLIQYKKRKDQREASIYQNWGNI